MGPGLVQTPCYPCNSCQGPPGCSQSSKVGGMGRGGIESLQGYLQVGQICVGNALGKLAQGNRRCFWAPDLNRCGHNSSLDLSLTIWLVWHQKRCMHMHKLMCTLHKGHVCDYILPQVHVGLSAWPSALKRMLHQTMTSITITTW